LAPNVGALLAAPSLSRCQPHRPYRFRAGTFRGCDFFAFAQKATLKTISLDVKKSPFANLVTRSERGEGSLFAFLCHALNRTTIKIAACLDSYGVRRRAAVFATNSATSKVALGEACLALRGFAAWPHRLP
jgi:hypothetical protein